MKKMLLYSSGIILEEKPTGGELRFLELAGAMSDRDDSALCCADPEEKLRERGLHAAYRLKEGTSAPKALPEEARILLSNRTLLKQIRQEAYDAVIAFDVPPAVGLCLSGVKNLVLMIRKDLIGYERAKTEKKGIRFSFRICYQWLCESLCLSHARMVICQCAYDRDMLVRRHPLYRKRLIQRTRIQINNVNPAWIIQRSEAVETVKRSIERFRICFIGGFDDLRKGQRLFLEAAEHLSEKYSDIEFLLVGGGKQQPSYAKRYASEQIRFFGRMDNPVGVLKSCDLLVVPSLADSCPNTVMEALYNHIPVIGSRAGGIPDILQDEAALFEPDTESLQKKAEAYYLDRDALYRLQTEQGKRAEELKFDWPERITGLILDS
ncbi:MAG: glycosyltransferase family 4 protein [Oscillospiraceae bacterium]|nr:glycosyltransferase family 4 protein [Oscillospiraceae bacterium]